ncbi:MAG: hypothetical protein ABJA16_14475, partial [Nakamurella sp.]
DLQLVPAGLVSEALGRARRLPADITTLPVAALGRAAKLSFELNQQLAELAGEGDRFIAGLRSPDEPPQRTAWSTIDDEDEVAARDPQAAATWDTAAPAPAPASGPILEHLTAPLIDDDPRVAPASPRLVVDDGSLTGPVRKARSPRPAGRRAGATPRAGARVDTTPAGAATRTSQPTITAPPTTEPTTAPPATAGSTVPGPPVGAGSDGSETPMDHALIADIAALEVERPAPLVGLPSPADDVTPDDPVDISSMSIGQLRGRVRNWPVEQVRSALAQEQREKARPAFLTVLTNRLSTLARGGA